MNTKIEIPPNARQILQVLEENGYEGYVVGGCVRDALMHRIPDDWDIATSATPQQVKALFRRTVETGISHGTITVLQKKEAYEVTTYRIDGTYEDHRHPSEVIFSTDITRDLTRRDFTINAMAYNDTAGLIDVFGGRKDLEAGIIRCVGNPRERFDEDALRVLRAVRFAAQLGFTIEPKTLEAVYEMVDTLAYVSKERVRVELCKLLLSEHPDTVRLLSATGMLRLILKRECQVTEKMLDLLQSSPKDLLLRLSILLRSFSEEEVQTLLRELRFDNVTLKKTSRLVALYDLKIEDSAPGVRKAVYLAGPELFERLLLLQTLEAAYTGDTKQETVLAHIRHIYGEILRKNECISMQMLKISGRDLLALGADQGTVIGEILQSLLEEVLEDTAKNTPAYLQQRAQEMIERHRSM
ncbi:MAG: CCA tRNA nucleotidyltransferase [Lachnospiraceae bacterium]